MVKGKDASIEVIKTDKAGPPVVLILKVFAREGSSLLPGKRYGSGDQTDCPGGIEAETRQTLENIRAILEEGGSAMDRVVSTFVFMTNLADFSRMNNVYAEYFRVKPPGRTTVEVKSLPAGAHVEITAFALANQS